MVRRNVQPVRLANLLRGGIFARIARDVLPLVVRTVRHQMEYVPSFRGLQLVNLGTRDQHVEETPLCARVEQLEP